MVRSATPASIYLRARYYDPSTGQFISRDPAVASTREPYAYSYDNPLNLTDPSGLDSWAGGFQLGWETGKTTPIGLPWDSKGGTVGVDNWQIRQGSTGTYGNFDTGKKNGWALGASCGIGGHFSRVASPAAPGGGWNDNPDQVLNTFHNVNFNVGLGGVLSGSVSWGGKNIWDDPQTVVFTGRVELGAGLSLSSYDTNTIPTDGVLSWPPKIHLPW